MIDDESSSALVDVSTRDGDGGPAAPLGPHSAGERRQMLARIGIGAIVVFVALIAIDGRRAAHVDTGDTNNLVQGSRVLIECLRTGDLIGCGRFEGTVQTAVFPYPPLQYVPATVLAWLSVTDRHILLALRWMNFGSLVVILAVFALAFRRRPRVLWLSWPVLIGSSLLYQSNASFGEALAAAAVVAAVGAAAWRRPMWAAAAVFVACLGKETLAPFVVVLCLLCARDRGHRLLPSRRLAVAIGAAGSVGWLSTALFNVFRYGGPRNSLYLDEPLRTAGLGRQIEWFAALWAAPAGGVGWFWPGFVLVMVTSCGVAVRAGDRRQQMLGVLPTVLLVGSVGGLALWFAPFGWITFGPRLAVPLLPAILFTTLWTCGEQIVEVLGRTWRRALSVAGVVTIASIPMYGSPWRWWNSIQDLISADPVAGCPMMTEFSVYDDPDTYYRCTSNTMWRSRPQILDDTVSLSFSVAGTAWLLAVLGCMCLLVASLAPARVTRAQSVDQPRSTRSTPGSDR